MKTDFLIYVMLGAISYGLYIVNNNLKTVIDLLEAQK